MDFNQYQKRAKRTDQFEKKDRSLSSSMWNLNETVALLSRKYDEAGRKQLDTEEYLDAIERKIGDILWYITNIASCHNFELNKTVEKNLKKCSTRWGKKKHELVLFDEGFPQSDQLPREITFKIFQEGNKTILAIKDGHDNWLQQGDRVNDNSHYEDGYRFHDAIHLTFMAKLGWSPVMRTLLKRKRKSDPKIDEVEDGARAALLEEAVSALIFEYAKERNFFEDVEEIPLELLKMIDRITRHLEVSKATFGHWEAAILEGYSIFRRVRDNNGGHIKINLWERKIIFSPESF